MSRIRHATEEFVNNLIRGINQLISTNTEQIKDLSRDKVDKTYVDTQNIKNMNYKNLVDNTRLYMATQTGIYLTPVSGVVDLPDGWAQGRHTLVCFNPTNDLYGFQLITTYAGSSGLGGNRKFAIRHAITEGSKWLDLATTEKTEILLLNGYEAVDSGRDELIVARSGNICNITGRIINRTTAPNGIVVGVLDEQYRPKKYRRAFVHYEADSKTVSCEIKPNGDITIYDNTVAINKGFRFNITYCIEQ